MTAPRNAPPDGEHPGRFDLEGFIYAVATAQPLPAGGAVAALVGALVAALAEMCAGLTARQPEYAAEAEMRATARQAAQWRAALLRAIDEDMAAYRQYMAARRLPVDTTAQRQQRRKALQ